MIHSEEICRRTINKSIKSRGQGTSSNKINGSFGRITRGKTLCSSYRRIQHVQKINPNLTKR